MSPEETKKHLARMRGAIKLLDVQSDSRANVSHSIMLGSDYTIYCTCEAWENDWRSVHSCKHLERLRMTLRQLEIVALGQFVGRVGEAHGPRTGSAGKKGKKAKKR